MQKITMFMFPECPYCVEALRLMEQVKAAHPEFAQIPLEMIDENRQRALADRFDYWYVPTYYVDGKKVHEGAVNRRAVEEVYRRAYGR